MTTYTWATSSGAFDQASSWSPATVPTPADTALLYAAGGTITGNGDVATLTVAAALWTLTGQIIASGATFDNTGWTVSGPYAQLELNQSLAVGLAGAAALSAAGQGAIVDAAPASGSTAQFGNATVNLTGQSTAVFAGNVSFGVNGTSTTATLDAALLSVGGTLLLGAGGSPATGTANVTVQDGAELLMTGAPNSASASAILQLGALAATSATLRVTGARSLLLSTSNSTAVGVAGTGTLALSAGGSARLGTANNGLLPALAVAAAAGSAGTVTVSGTGTLLNASGSIVIGNGGVGALVVSGGGTVQSSAGAPSAFSVAGRAGSGSVSIDGAGSVVAAGGSAVIGGDNRGAGATQGGTGSVSVTNGGAFQAAGLLTVFAGSRLSVDGASSASIGGNLALLGIASSAGALTIGGTEYGSGTLQIGGGSASVGGISSGTVSFTGAHAALTLHGVAGSNTIAGMHYGDTVDLAGITNVNIGNNELFFQGGATIVLTGAAVGTQYELGSDGSGGTLLSISADTIGVYRFFDSRFGTHFFTSSSSEESEIAATRPDLVYEGVGLQSVDPAASDPNAAPIYRFFDSSYGTHFFTASVSERDQVIASRPDLVYEGVGFYEHTAAQAGDVPVYRFFDSNYGTHFYTASSSEESQIAASRPDLIYEGIGFYAPA